MHDGASVVITDTTDKDEPSKDNVEYQYQWARKVNEQLTEAANAAAKDKMKKVTVDNEMKTKKTEMNDNS